MGRPRRIICYAVNGSGLGHATRLCAIARWMRRLLLLLDRRMPEIDFLTSTEAPSLLSNAGFPVYKLPSKTQIRASGLDITEFKRLAKHFVWNMLGCFSCDLLVVDTFPQGSFDELLQILDGPFKKCLILRRVKDEFAARPVFRAALSLYDQIAIPHEEGSWNPPAPAQFGGEVIGVERDETCDHRALCERFGLPIERKVVYVSAGGGGDPLAENTLDCILQQLAKRPEWHALVGAGPLYRGKRRSGPQLTWCTETGISPYLAGCDFAVSAAGYNSFNELLHLGVPSIFYAQTKIADDQAERIENAQMQGACLEWNPTAPETLLELCDRALHEASSLARAAKAFRPQNGAKQCAQIALSTLESPERLAWAAALCTGRLARLLDRVPPETAQAIARTIAQIAPPSPNDLERLMADRLCVKLRNRCPELDEAALNAVFTPQKDDDNAALAEVFCDLCEACEQSLDLEKLCDFLLLAIRRQPAMPNESDRAWLTAILSGTRAILEGHTASEMQDRLQLLRIFPKVIDLDAQSVFALAKRYIDSRQGQQIHNQIKELQVLKITQRRIEAAHLIALCEKSA